MPTGQDLGDLFANAAGANINRPQMNAFIANSQARNGLVSAQTQDAMIKAQQAQEELDAHQKLPQAIADANPGMKPSEAALAATYMVGHLGDAQTSLKALGTGMLGFGTPAQQVSGQQMNQGKVAPLQAVPNNYAVPAGQAPPDVLQSPQGAAQTAQTQALTGKDVAQAELEHANAKAAGTKGTSTLDPDTLDKAARVVMADPNKMSTYAGFGQSGQANKDAINTRVSQMLNQARMSTDQMIQQRAIAKASVGSAGAAAKQQQALDAFTPLVKANGDRVNQLLDQIDAAGGAGIDEPIINGFQRMVGRQLGSNDLAELHSVFASYQSEVARLLASGPSMNGVISDHARTMLGQMAPETMSASQARQVLGRIDTEISIRRQGVHNSLNEAAAAQLPVSSPHTDGNVPAPTGAAGALPTGFHALN